MARPSLAMSRMSLDVSSTADVMSEASGSTLGANNNAIAYLVYANRGDPYSAGYKSPTTRDIPQIKLPRIDRASGVDLGSYKDQIRKFENAMRAGDLSLVVDDAPDATKDTLSSIPEPFFSKNFQLDNPRVYDAVIGDEDPNLLQEKLSWYVDIVETHLAREIAKASTQFFDATAKFGAIEEQAAETTKRIHELESVVKVQGEVVNHFQETELLQRKLRDATLLCRSIELLASFKECVQTLEQAVNDLKSLPDNGVASCVALLRKAREMAEDTTEIDLHQVVAAIPLIDRVSKAEEWLKSQAASQYVAAMLEQLRTALLKSGALDESGVAAAQQQGIAEQEVAAEQSVNDALDAVKELDCLPAAVDQYHQEIDREVKIIIKRNVPPAPSGSNADSSQALARSLHAMSARAADEMCEKFFSQLSSLFYALKEQTVAKLGTELLDGAIRSADGRLTRILRVRKDPVTTLDTHWFLKFYWRVTDFCETCSTITGGRAKTEELGEFLLAQTKLYVHSLHSFVENRLMIALESDDWRRADVTPETQISVDLIAESAVRNPASWSQESKTSFSDTGSKQRLELDTHAYVVSKSTPKLISGLEALLQLVVSLPIQHIPSVVFELLELMRTFNHKSHSLILGFGATKTAGLKHISVKNLILCFESLRFFENLLDYMKKCVQRRILLSEANEITPDSSAMSDIKSDILSSFDSVQQAYFDHRKEIHTKLVKLMSDKVSVYSRQIAATDWSQPSPQANKYMHDLVRQTTTVAHIAQEMMPPSLSLKLIEEIYSAYKPKLLEAYSSINVETVAEKRNVLRDLAYFKVKSEALTGAGNIGEVIYESVNGFVAPELSVDPSTPVSERPSMESRRYPIDEGDNTLAYEPSEEPHEEKRSGSQPPEEVHQSENVLSSLPESHTSSTNGTGHLEPESSDKLRIEQKEITPALEETEEELNKSPDGTAAENSAVPASTAESDEKVEAEQQPEEKAECDHKIETSVEKPDTAAEAESEREAPQESTSPDGISTPEPAAEITNADVNAKEKEPSPSSVADNDEVPKEEEREHSPSSTTTTTTAPSNEETAPKLAVTEEPEPAPKPNNDSPGTNEAATVDEPADNATLSPAKESDKTGAEESARPLSKSQKKRANRKKNKKR